MLSEISSLCIKYNAEYVCIGGDFNIQFSRRESLNTKTILQFIDKDNLYIPLIHSYANVDYSYSNLSANTYSIINHVLVSSNLSDVISSYYSICNDAENKTKLDNILHYIHMPYELLQCYV